MFSYQFSVRNKTNVLIDLVPRLVTCTPWPVASDTNRDWFKDRSALEHRQLSVLAGAPQLQKREARILKSRHYE